MLALVHIFRIPDATLLYISVHHCSLPGWRQVPSKAGGFVVVVFAVAILIYPNSWTSLSANMVFCQAGISQLRGFEDSNVGSQKGSQAKRLLYSHHVDALGESTALAGCLDLAKVRAAAVPANHDWLNKCPRRRRRLADLAGKLINYP